MPSIKKYGAMVLVLVGTGFLFAPGPAAWGGEASERNDQPGWSGTASESGSQQLPSHVDRLLAAAAAREGPIRGTEEDGGSAALFDRPVGSDPSTDRPVRHDSSGSSLTPSSSRPSDPTRPLPLAPPHRADRSVQPGPNPPSPTARTALSVGASLVVCLGLFLLLAWVMRRSGAGPVPLLPKEVLEILGRAPIAGRQQLHLIRLGGRLILVSVTAAGVETLSEITETDEVQRLVALCRQQHPSSATAMFRQVLERFGVEGETAGPWGSRSETVSGVGGGRGRGAEVRQEASHG